MDLPSVLVVSSCDYPPVNVIQDVFDSQLPAKNSIDENITAYAWPIDNKYYTATINLCALNDKIIGNETFANSVEAIVIYFDSDCAQGLDAAESWLPFTEVYEAEIKLLVCRNCHSSEGNGYVGVSKRSAQEWCIQRGFELVEMEPNLDDIDPEDDFPETVGVARIRQALHAHEWPNLVLKTDGNRSLENRDPFQESIQELIESSDDFGDLFSQLSEMKDRVAMLSGEERKIAAEQIALAFYSAMGGDEDDVDI